MNQCVACTSCGALSPTTAPPCANCQEIKQLTDRINALTAERRRLEAATKIISSFESREQITEKYLVLREELKRNQPVINAAIALAEATDDIADFIEPLKSAVKTLARF